MAASQVVGAAVGIVERDGGRAFFLEREFDRGAGAEARIGGSAIVGGELATLVDVGSASGEAFEERVFEAEAEIVAEERIGGEVGSDGETLIPLFEEEVVACADVKTGGEFHFGGTKFDGHVVASVVDSGEGHAGAAEAHGGADVLEGDTELDFVVGAGHVLDTGVDGDARGGHVIRGLGDDLEDGTTVDGIGEGMGETHVEVHDGGREGAVAAGFGVDFSGSVEVAEAHGHDVSTEDAGVAETDGETEAVDGGAATEAAFAAQPHGVGVDKFGFFNEGETSDVAEESIDTAGAGSVDAPPAAGASPGVDQQF